MLQQLCNAAQNLIARRMAIGVIDTFEKIQVKHEKSKIGLSLRGALKLVTQMGHRVAPIIKPR